MLRKIHTVLKNLTILIMVICTGVAYSQVTTQQDGDYTNNATWIGNSPNEGNEDVLILHHVNLNTNIDIGANFELGTGGSLTGTSGRNIKVSGFGHLTVGDLNIDGDIEVSNDATFTVKSGDTVYVDNLTFKNNTLGFIEAGAVVYVANDFTMQNNADITIHGELHVGNKITAKNGSSIIGDGTVYAGPNTDFNNSASIFGSYTECTNCVYSNGCTLNTTYTEWTGAVDNNWYNGSNWSNGLPNQKTPVRITSTPITPLTVTGAPDCFHIVIESGATLTMAANSGLNIYGNFENHGTFIENNSTVAFRGSCWPAEVTASVPTQFFNLTCANTEGVTIKSGEYNLINTLTMSAGTLTTNDSLTLISSATSTARIAQITNGASIAGAIVMQRYIDAGATYWRHLGSAVQGATIEQFNDDFTTAGYPGSLFPNFGWCSVYYYDETLTGTAGYLQTTGSTQVMQVGQGFQVYCGDTIVGTQPFIFDLRGVPNQGNINIPLTYTNYGLPANDGWNLVSNPYASTIDWDDPDWTRNNVANATYILNPDTEQYATYVAGASTNGGSRYIASQQSFWVQTFGASPQLVATEGVKSPVDQAFIKANAIESPGMKIRIQGNAEFDEAIVRHVDGASDAFDHEVDAVKYWGGWGQYPQVSLLNQTAQDLTVHSFDKSGSEWSIPLRVVVFQDGLYNLEFEGVGEMDVPCMQLEDTYTGDFYLIEEGVALPFMMDDSTYAPRFILHVGMSYETQTSSVSCKGGSDGEMSIDLDMSQSVDYNLHFNGNIVSGNNYADPLVINNLEAGIYQVEIPTLSNLCNQTIFSLVINEPAPLSFNEVITDESFGNDGAIQVNPMGGTSPYIYTWSTGDISNIASNLTSGQYLLQIEDANGCVYDETFVVGSVLSNHEILDDEILYYYAPQDQNVVIENWQRNEPTELFVFNNMGQLVQKVQISAGANKINVPVTTSLPSGVYIIKSEDWVFKFVK